MPQWHAACDTDEVEPEDVIRFDDTTGAAAGVPVCKAMIVLA